MHSFDKDGSVREMFPNLDSNKEEQAKFLDFSRKADEETMLGIVNDYSDSPEILDFLARNGTPFDEKFFLIISRRATKTETLQWIYNRYHGIGVINTIKSYISPELEPARKQVRTMIALHPNAPLELLETFLENEEYKLEGAIIRNASFPIERKEQVLIGLLKDESRKMDALNRKELPNEERFVALEEFMKSHDREHWLTVAKLNYLDVGTVRALLAEGNIEVKKVLFKNVTLSSESYEILAQEENAELLGLLGTNFGMPPAILKSLAEKSIAGIESGEEAEESKSALIGLAVASNQYTPKETLETFVNLHPELEEESVPNGRFSLPLASKTDIKAKLRYAALVALEQKRIYERYDAA